MSKYRIPVYIETCASHSIGDVECDSIEEYYEKAEALWEEKGWDSPSTNITNDFDLSDWDLGKVLEEDLKYHKIEEKS